MIHEKQDLPPADGVDFETAVSDPAAFYAHPDDISADPELTPSQRRRFLMEWAQDIEDRQSSVAEGMGASEAGSGEPGDPDQDAQLLQRIHASIARLPDDQTEPPPQSTAARLWRRLLAP